MSTTEVIRTLRFAATVDKAMKGLQAEPVAAFLGNEWTRSLADRPVVTAREYAELVIELANSGRIPLAKALALAGGAHPPDDPQRRGAFVQDDLRNEIRAVLTKIAADHKREGRRLAPLLAAKIEGRVAALPVFSKTGIVHRYIAIDTPDAINFGLALLCGSSLAADLCQCKLEGCGRFFFVERDSRRTPGRLRRNYCSTEHRVDAHRQQAAHRLREFRKRDRAKREGARRSK